MRKKLLISALAGALLSTGAQAANYDFCTVIVRAPYVIQGSVYPPNASFYLEARGQTSTGISTTLASQSIPAPDIAWWNNQGSQANLSGVPAALVGAAKFAHARGLQYQNGAGGHKCTGGIHTAAQFPGGQLYVTQIDPLPLPPAPPPPPPPPAPVPPSQSPAQLACKQALNNMTVQFGSGQNYLTTNNAIGVTSQGMTSINAKHQSFVDSNASVNAQLQDKVIYGVMVYTKTWEIAVPAANVPPLPYTIVPTARLRFGQCQYLVRLGVSASAGEYVLTTRSMNGLTLLNNNTQLAAPQTCPTVPTQCQNL